MREKASVRRSVLFVCTMLVCALWMGCHPASEGAKQADTFRDGATFEADGTAHITRVVPMPSTVSPEAQKWLASLTQKSNAPQTLEQRRAGTDEWRNRRRRGDFIR